MKCLYQDCECRYTATHGMPQHMACKECELYDPHRVRLSRGCAQPAIAIVLVIILLLFSKCNANAQYNRYKQPNSVYVAFQPVDLGLGVRYDHSFNDMGIYGSVSYGNYMITDVTYIKDHIKYTIGTSIYLRDWKNWHYAFNTGLNYHTWGEVKMDDTLLSSRIFNPWSFELGLSIKMPRFAIGFRTDILRWEPCIDIGIPFKYKRL